MTGTNQIHETSKYRNFKYTIECDGASRWEAYSMSDKQRARSGKSHRRRQRKRRQQYNAVMRLLGVAVSLLVIAAVVIAVAPRRSKTAIYTRSKAGPEVEIAGPVITLEPEKEEAPGVTEAPEPTQQAPAAQENPVKLTDRVQEPEPTSAVITAEQLFKPQTTQAAESDDYLPVYKRVDTLEKKIAITVDDCFQVANLRTIITTAYNSKGHLTLFPIGENFAKSGMRETLLGAMKAGCELENHTWSHSRVFRLPEFQMAEEIWKQRVAMNELLGMTYKQHFFRLMGGDGSSDRRTHNYLKQLGYYGIAEWQISGSDETIETIKKSLAPGLIYLFHTTDADTEKLKQFIPYAVSQGYELVTLNELLGFPDNETSEYREETMPMPRPYTEDYRPHKVGDYAWNVVRLQDKLRALGFLEMDGQSTGYYGEKTAQAVKDYQNSIGFSATGIADSETQKKLLET